jgi:shikimate dehydrogenase
LENPDLRIYGLIGRSLLHSFSPAFFLDKFQREGIQDVEYLKLELSEIADISSLLTSESRICGFNVTIPYKQDIIPYLDRVDPVAREIGAVNTVLVERVKATGAQLIPGVHLSGFNTDVFGFRDSVKPLIRAGTERALVLGTGGSAKAVSYMLRSMGIRVLQVSRNPEGPEQIGWNQLNEYVIRHHLLIVNTTPLGQYPNADQYPELPYEAITADHVLYDLIYNPEETNFLLKGQMKGAQIQNGYSMLCIQAEYSWKIWQEGG